MSSDNYTDQPGWDARDTDFLGRIMQLPVVAVVNSNALVSRDHVIQCVLQMAAARRAYKVEQSENRKALTPE